jgi:phage gp46-like protein
MVEITVRYEEASEPQPFLLWDSIWNPAIGWADYAIAAQTETGNVGGMQSLHALNTAIVLCLFTWTRRADYQGNQAGPDPQGWWGDAIDLDTDNGERPMGSLLWLLLRSPLTVAVAAQAVSYAKDALQTLIDQGVVGSFTITSNIDKPNERLDLFVSAFSLAGQKIYGQKFSQIWGQEFPG